jgi:hypothetical protein
METPFLLLTDDGVQFCEGTSAARHTAVDSGTHFST